MQKITTISLSGGQGKTTACIFLSRKLAKLGCRVLAIDGDPQSSLTFYLGHQVESDRPTLLEVIKKQVPTEGGVYPLDSDPNLWIIPSDQALDNAQEYLSASGMGAVILDKRLQEVKDLFSFCIIDAPPQRSQIVLTCLGAADYLIIPVEASSKGVSSLLRTLELVEELSEIGAFTGKILGVLPFRDRWTGRNQTTTCRKSINAMKEIVGDSIKILPSLLESEKFKKAIDAGTTLTEMGNPSLENPFNRIIEELTK